MPTYQYKCNNKHYHEEYRSIHDSPITEHCEQCGDPLKPVYSVPSVALIGRGFYSNGG